MGSDGFVKNYMGSRREPPKYDFFIKIIIYYDLETKVLRLRGIAKFIDGMKRNELFLLVLKIIDF